MAVNATDSTSLLEKLLKKKSPNSQRSGKLLMSTEFIIDAKDHTDTQSN